MKHMLFNVQEAIIMSKEFAMNFIFRNINSIARSELASDVQIEKKFGKLRKDRGSDVK